MVLVVAAPALECVGVDAVAAVRSASAEPGDACRPADSVESHWDAAVAVADGTSVDWVPDGSHPACLDGAATFPRQSVAESPPVACAHTPNTPRACTAADCPPCPSAGPAGTRPALSGPQTPRN